MNFISIESEKKREREHNFFSKHLLFAN
jgi:hypothetical protein